MLPLAVVFGSAGAMLILIGLVGGGFTFSGSVMPRVGGISRVLSFSVGGVLVVIALAITSFDLDVRSEIGPAPIAPATAAPPAEPSWETAPSVAPSTDQQVIDLLTERPSFDGL